MKSQPRRVFDRRQAALLIGGAIGVLVAQNLWAAPVITYTNGQTDATAYSTSPPNDATTLNLASGTATQSGVLSGTGAVIKDGGGALTLSGANSYSGGTTVSQGGLVLTGNSAAGTGLITLGNAGTGANNLTLNFNAGSSVLANAITVSSQGSGTAVIDQGSNYSSLTGLMTLNRATTINSSAGDRSDISGKITGSVGTLTFSGVRTTLGATSPQTAGNASDFTGNVVIASGTLQVQSAYALSQTADVTVNAGAIFRPLVNVSINGLNGAGTVTGDSGGGNSAKTLTVGVSNGSGSFSGTIGNGNLCCDTVTFRKDGTGTQVLTGENSYSGGTTINAGTLQIGNGGTTGRAGGNGTITNNASLVFNRSDNNYTVNNVITGSGNLTHAGSGELTLRNSNSYTGTTTINGGTLIVENGGPSTPGRLGSGAVINNGNLVFRNTVDMDVANAISGSGGLTQGFGGTLRLSGASSYTGTTAVNRGAATLVTTLVVDMGSNATVLNAASALTLGNGNFQLAGAAGANRVQVLNGLSITAGANVVDVNNLGTSTTLDLRGSSGLMGITRSAGATLDFRATAGTLGSTAIVMTHQANDASGILGTWATVNGGAGLAANNGSDVIVAYSGYADIAAKGPGSLVADATLSNVRINTAGTAGNITLGGATTTSINMLMQNTATAAVVDTAGKTLRLGTTGGILMTPTAATTGALTIGAAVNDGVLTAGGNTSGVAGQLTLFNNSGSALTINAAVMNNGTGVVSLNKVGAGGLTLAGTNTYTGATTVDAGTLALANVNALQFSTLNNVEGTVSFAVTGNNTYNIGGLTGSRAMAIGANTFSVGANSESTSYSGTLSGIGGGLTKVGAGTLTLSAGRNAQTGVTTFREGTLSVATLGNGGFANTNLSRATSAATNLVFDGGALQYTGATASSDRNFTINAGKTATFDITTNNLTLSGAAVASTGGLTKTGAGTLTLTGANLHTGDTTVHAGTLVLGSTGSVASRNYIVGDAGSSNATLDVTAKTGGLVIGAGQKLSGIGTVLGAVTLQGGSLLAPGNSVGTLTTGNLLFSGGVYAVEIASGVLADQLNVIGTAGLGADTELLIELLNGYDPLVGDSWVLVNNDGSDAFATTGRHFTISGAALLDDTAFSFGGRNYLLDYNGGSGNDVVLRSLDAPAGPPTANGIPEPGTAALVLLAGAQLFALRRKWRRVDVMPAAGPSIVG